MYLVRTDVVVPPGRAKEFESWWAGFGPVLKAAKGFQYGGLLNSLGEPGRYASLARFESREAFRDYYLGERLRSHLQEGAGLIALTRPQHGYELVLRVGDPAVSGVRYGRLVEWTIDRGAAAAQAFASSRKELFELRQKLLKDFITQSLWRSPGTPNKHLAIGAYKTREGAEAQGPEVDAFMSKYPYSNYASAPPTVENFEAVHEVRA